MIMNYRLLQTTITALAIFFSLQLSAQPAAIVGKKIVGTWRSEEKGLLTYIFSVKGDCTVYMGEGSPLKYKYQITNDPKDCNPDISKDTGDTTAYIILKNVKEGDTDCLVIEGISHNQLSLRGFGMSGTYLYLKEQKKTAKSKF